MTSDVTVEILREIRDEIRGTRHELRSELEELRVDLGSARLELKAELGATRQELSERLASVEGATLDVAQQQRFVVRYLKGLTARDRHLEAQVAQLEGRVEVLEKKSKR
jgi:chromosome segregation ATPase